MTRIRQFANDMGISYNKAKGLINKGKKRRDGGSTILEKFTMPIVIREKKNKKKKKEPKGGGPLMTPGQKKFLDKQTGKGKPEEAKSGKFMKAADGKITKLRKKTSNKAKMGNFKNIVNASVSGKITPQEAEKRIRKLVISKAMGGLNSGLKDIPPENKGLPKLPKEVRNKMGFKKDGGTINKEFPEPEMRTGEFRIDMIPKEYREFFRKKFMSKRGPASRKTKEKKMMGGGAMNMMPRRMMMKKGGIARGGGAAISGTGFKGVY
jgi:hypothetical protein